MTEEEIKLSIGQGTQAGIFEESEQEMIDSVFGLSDRRISQLMTPRLDIVWLDVADSPEEIEQKISASPYSRFPVCRGGLDNVLGVVKAKEMLSRSLSGDPIDLKAYMKRPLFVPESRTALQVLELFKGATHI